MERKSKPLQGLMAVIGFLVLIIDSRQALTGAVEGIELCMKTVIPSLFPFFVLSMMLTQSLDPHDTSIPASVAEFLKIPPAASSVLIPSVFGGYPVGAKCIGELYHEKQITKCDAERLLGFCSNAGPAFLFGMISGLFPERKIIWLLWFIHIFSAAMTAVTIPDEITKAENQHMNAKAPQNAIINSSAKAICLVCCWVILFRIIVSFCKKWFLWIFPIWIQVLFTGVLELTNGCCELLLIQNLRLRFIVCSCMLAFGGICVVCQTAAVIEGLSLKSYIKGKIIQTSFSFLLSYVITAKQWVLLSCLVPLWCIILRKLQNKSGNPISVPV